MQRSNTACMSLFMWLLMSCHTAMNIVTMCAGSASKRSEFSALSARGTGHLSAEKTHSLPSSPPHPSLNVPQRDMWLFLSIPRHSGWLEFDRLGPRGRIVHKGQIYGSCWLGCHSEKCLKKRYQPPALMLCRHCLYLPLFFPLCCYLTPFVVFIYILKLFSYCGAMFPVRLFWIKVRLLCSPSVSHRCPGKLLILKTSFVCMYKKW